LDISDQVEQDLRTAWWGLCVVDAILSASTRPNVKGKSRTFTYLEFQMPSAISAGTSSNWVLREWRPFNMEADYKSTMERLEVQVVTKLNDVLGHLNVFPSKLRQKICLRLQTNVKV
jgi:hypothetical protein